MTETTQFMTAIFKCDLRKVDGNPHHKDTPFGRAVTLAVGDAITDQQAEIERLRAALVALLDLNDNHGPFGGEMYQDRIDRTWNNARKALEAKP